MLTSPKVREDYVDIDSDVILCEILADENTVKNIVNDISNIDIKYSDYCLPCTKLLQFK